MSGCACGFDFAVVSAGTRCGSGGCRLPCGCVQYSDCGRGHRCGGCCFGRSRCCGCDCCRCGGSCPGVERCGPDVSSGRGCRWSWCGGRGCRCGCYCCVEPSSYSSVAARQSGRGCCSGCDRDFDRAAVVGDHFSFSFPFFCVSLPRCWLRSDKTGFNFLPCFPADLLDCLGPLASLAGAWCSAAAEDFFRSMFLIFSPLFPWRLSRGYP